MRLFRLFDRTVASAAMSGAGAAVAGGRWNSKGTKVVYASETLALAVLEVITNARGKIPPNKVYVTIDVPDDARVDTVHVTDLPMRWWTYPPPSALARLGDEWVRRGKSVALVVPSAVVRVEHNVLLNPSHRDFGRIRVSPFFEVPADARLQNEGRGRRQP